VLPAIKVFQEVMGLPENEQRALLMYLLAKFGYPDPRASLPWDDLEDEEADRAYERLVRGASRDGFRGGADAP